MKMNKKNIGVAIIGVITVIAAMFMSTKSSKADLYLSKADSYYELARQESCKEIGWYSSDCFSASEEDKDAECVPLQDARFKYLQNFGEKAEDDCAGIFTQAVEPEPVEQPQEQLFGDEKWNQ